LIPIVVASADATFMKATLVVRRPYHRSAGLRRGAWQRSEAAGPLAARSPRYGEVMPLTSLRARAGGGAAMLRRRELLLGMGVAALGACAPRLREPAASGTVPVGAAARWPPFAAGVTIDAAAEVTLVWPDDMDPAVVAGLIARDL